MITLSACECCSGYVVECQNCKSHSSKCSNLEMWQAAEHAYKNGWRSRFYTLSGPGVWLCNNCLSTKSKS